jgi:hypothetical protein
VTDVTKIFLAAPASQVLFVDRKSPPKSRMSRLLLAAVAAVAAAMLVMAVPAGAQIPPGTQTAPGDAPQ